MVSRPAKNPEKTVRRSAVRELRVRASKRLCMKIRINNPEKERQRESADYPSAYCIGKFYLIDQCLLIHCNALAEHIVCPALIDQDDRDKDQSDDRHDCQRILG